MSDAAEQPRETARSPTGFPGTRWLPKAKTAAAIAVVCSPKAGHPSAWLVSDLGLRNVHALGDQGEWEPALGARPPGGPGGRRGSVAGGGLSPPGVSPGLAVRVRLAYRSKPPFPRFLKWDPGSRPVHLTERPCTEATLRRL